MNLHIPHIPLPGDTLTRAEKRRANLDDAYADCSSVLGDLETAMALLDEMALADNDMVTAYDLLDKALALVARKRQRIESGDDE